LYFAFHFAITALDTSTHTHQETHLIQSSKGGHFVASWVAATTQQLPL